MEDNISNENIFNKNPTLEANKINDNQQLFKRLQNLQILIKKESSLKELCKNLK